MVVRLLTEPGIEPVSWLEDRESDIRLTREPIHEGTGPVILL
jgi:hypothetical protein